MCVNELFVGVETFGFGLAAVGVEFDPDVGFSDGTDVE